MFNFNVDDLYAYYQNVQKAYESKIVVNVDKIKKWDKEKFFNSQYENFVKKDNIYEIVDIYQDEFIRM